MEETPEAAMALARATKRYGDLAAVSDLTLAARQGEILGFLGPNGAGKTTTILMLTGFLKPTSGSVALLGHNMADAMAAKAARQRLGFVPDVAGLDPTARGEWLLEHLARLQGRPAVDRARLADLLELQTRDLKRPMGRLSRGTRQKINIVQGLQHRPDLLILDEPTEGLDPLAKRVLFDLLSEARARGTTIFFSSHILSEVEALCDRVALIRGGRLVAVDTIADMRAHLQRRVVLQLSEPRDIRPVLVALPAVTDIQHLDGQWQFSAGSLQPVLALLATLPVQDVTIAPPSLAEVFMQYYGAPADGRTHE